jgi:hypothetical protein
MKYFRLSHSKSSEKEDVKSKTKKGNNMVQRAKAVELIESKLTPLVASLIKDARGSGQESPYKVQIYVGGNGDSGKEIAEFSVKTNPAGELEWNANDKNNILQRMIAPLAASSGEQELWLHVHGAVSKPTEGHFSLNFAGIGGEQSAEA